MYLSQKPANLREGVKCGITKASRIRGMKSEDQQHRSEPSLCWLTIRKHTIIVQKFYLLLCFVASTHKTVNVT